MAIHSVKHGMTNAEIEDLFFVLAQFINQSGVIATGDLLVEAQATPDMTVKAAVGRAVLKTSDGRNGYPVYNDASANVTIAANSSGVAKIDAVVLYWDGAAASDASATNVAKLTTVRGTASATPTDAEIQTAVGAGNPFLRLADVAVANGVASINSGNITDKRVYCDPNIRRAGGLADGIVTYPKLELSALPRVRLKHSANQPADNNVETNLLWDGEDFDIGGLHDPVTSNQRITIPTGEGGLWLVGCGVAWDSNSTGYRVLNIARFNSAAVAQEYVVYDRRVAHLNSEATLVGLVNASAGDYFMARVTQNSGVTLNVLATGATGLTAATRFWAVKVAD